MPKDEFDFEDPFELNGMAFLSHEDTTNDMAECFTEEFMRMGYSHKQVLALFRNPHYLGPHMALEKRGEPFIRDLIADVFARWGRSVEWPSVIASPLTPALSPTEGERENPAPSHGEPVTADRSGEQEMSNTHSSPFPLPLGGEGSGEGARGECSLTDPTGAPIPEYTV